MSNVLPSRPRHLSQRRTFAIVSSQYNAAFVEGLVEHALRELGTISPNFQTEEFRVPGAFEIPLVVQELAKRKDLDAIIALGVIIEGETQHAALIGAAITQSLQQIGLAFVIPVIHEVLVVKTAEQARKRCLEEALNRGTEAARIAAQMVQVMSDVRSSSR
ncbi:MAG: 6,7-dimethyl-8-ribityllumazine synthase [Chthoniobacter sp.]|jgi:6,7-dimethyl-8-ribityllumazine synthase|nr:6,7-dimethyl-8-ribityllumazine synthase [Chthoniobacter sp.]